MIRKPVVFHDDRNAPSGEGEVLDGWKWRYFGESEVGKNHHEVVKQSVGYFTDLKKVKEGLCEDLYDAEDFWRESGEIDKVLEEEAVDEIEKWNGKTPLTIKGYEPNNWGGSVRYEVVPKRWRGLLKWSEKVPPAAPMATAVDASASASASVAGTDSTESYVWLAERGEEHEGAQVLGVCKTQHIAILKVVNAIDKGPWSEEKWVQKVKKNGDILWRYKSDYYRVSRQLVEDK